MPLVAAATYRDAREQPLRGPELTAADCSAPAGPGSTAGLIATYGPLLQPLKPIRRTDRADARKLITVCSSAPSPPAVRRSRHDDVASLKAEPNGRSAVLLCHSRRRVSHSNAGPRHLDVAELGILQRSRSTLGAHTNKFR